MGFSTTPTCVLELPLITEKWQEDRLKKEFAKYHRSYNILMHSLKDKYEKLVKTEEYLNIMAEMERTTPRDEDGNVIKFEKGEKKPKDYKEALNKRSDFFNKNGYSKFSFLQIGDSFVKEHKEFGLNTVIFRQTVALPMWSSFEKKIYKNGKRLRFRNKTKTITSTPATGLVYKNDGYIYFLKKNKSKSMKLKIAEPATDYEEDMLTKKVKLVTIVRKNINGVDKYFAQLSVEGIPSAKYDEKGNTKVQLGKGVVGIDIGVTTVAAVSDFKVLLRELAPEADSIDAEIKRLTRKLERSRRQSNPQNYNEDGTIKKGKKVWHYTNNYWKTRKKLEYLQSKSAQLRKKAHNTLANEILQMGNIFIWEKMDFAELQKRKTKTEYKKNGQPKSKKKFGKLIGHKAPSAFMTILKNKIEAHGGIIITVNPEEVKASQYNHFLDIYEKKTLAQRCSIVADYFVQRDLYSAFLLQNINDDHKTFNREECMRKFESFVALHNAEIIRLHNSPHVTSSMGVEKIYKKIA